MPKITPARYQQRTAQRMLTNGYIGIRYCTIALVVFASTLKLGIVQGQSPFFMGADISMVPFLETRGASYTDGGIELPAEQILANHGANLFRLRLFVNPSANYDAPSNRGAIQDLEYVIYYAQRMKVTGARFMLSLHYSDTWTNPGLQGIPADWPAGAGEFEQLKTRVHDYTTDTLTALREAGVMPDVVQIGNETTSGMLWPRGQIVYTSPSAQTQSWQRYGQLVNSAISAVREQQLPGEHVDVAVTIAPGDEWYGGTSGGLPRWFMNNFINTAGVSDFDIIGIDSYPETQAQYNGLINNLNDLATRFNKKILVGETSYPWNHSLDGTGPGDYDGYYNPANEPFPTTTAGQLAFWSSLRDVVRNLPNNRGMGLLWWYPETIPVDNTYIWKGGTLGLFGSQGEGLPSLDAFHINLPSADFDRDGQVNGRDFLLWQRNYAENSLSSVPLGDANYDGDVDAGDLAVWQIQYGQAALLQLNAVPEPHTGILLLVFIATILRTGRS